MTARATVTVLEVSCTDVMHAIARARRRMEPLTGADLAMACLQEMQFIILAFDAYEARVADAQTERVLQMVFPDGVPR